MTRCTFSDALGRESCRSSEDSHMSRTYRNRMEYDWDEWNRTRSFHRTVTLNSRALDSSSRSHFGRYRCVCQGPRDPWHKKRFRRAVRAGATNREAQAARGW